MTEQKQRISRGEFLVGGVGLVIGGTILRPVYDRLHLPQPQLRSQSKVEQSITEPSQNLFGIYGLHDTPNVGGSNDLSIFKQDVGILKPRWVTFTSPSSHLLRFSQATNLSIISRIYQQENHFDAQLIKNEVSKAFEFLKNPVFQPFNEVNLLEETGGGSLPPEEHILKHFLPSAELISKIAENYQRRAQILITPLAQRSPNEETYFPTMLRLLKPYLNKFDCDFALGLHSYIFEEDEDPLAYIKERYALARDILGVGLPIFVTEAGLHQTVEKKFPDDIVAKQTRKILETYIPVDLPIKAYVLWLLANYAQRPLQQKNPILDNYEQAAIRRSSGITDTYRAIADLQ